MNPHHPLQKDWPRIVLLMIFGIVLYFPVFYSDYLYTDEAVQLWWYRPGSDFDMFTEQGRWLTDRLMRLMFGSISTIAEVKYLRIFSFAGWLLMVPVWFRILKAVFKKERLDLRLVPVLIVLLLASPTVTISIGWASCLELFIAYTAGLVSGYIAYRMFASHRALGFRTLLMLGASMVCGIIALFTYQNGIGCFLLPFLIHLIAGTNRYKFVSKGVLILFAICITYYILFRWQVFAWYNMPSGGERTYFGFNVFKKMRFFFLKVLPNTFRFGFLVTETSRIGVLISAIVFAIVAITYSIRTRISTIVSSKQLNDAAGINHISGPDPAHIQKKGNSHWFDAAKNLGAIVILIMLMYLPSMAVKENYASNRTLLAVSLGCACWALVTFYYALTSSRARVILCTVIMVLAGANAVYNYNYQFRKPLEQEYQTLRYAMSDPVYDEHRLTSVLRPPEDLFVRKYGITRSWDEFGVPSNFFSWVPAYLISQIRFEMGEGRSKNVSGSILMADSPPEGPELLDAIHASAIPPPFYWLDPKDRRFQWFLFEQ